MERKLIILAALCIVFIISTAGSIIYATSITSNTSAISDKNKQISNLQEEATLLNAQIDSMNTTIQQLNGEIAQKNEAMDSLNNKIIDLNSQISNLTSQIDGLNSQIATQSKLVIDTITVTDERSSTANYLHITCRVNNTGPSTAYNAFLRTLAFNDEGLAIDDYHTLTGITGGMSIGMDFTINYTGSPINNWMVTPIWTTQLVIPTSGTLP
jgi:cell division protein FtsB